MSLMTFRVRCAAVTGAVALAAVACAPATSAPPAPTAAANAPPQPTAAPKPGAPTSNPVAATEGQALIAQKGCGACHVVPGVPGATGVIGPNLTGVATRSSIAGGALQNNGPDDLKRWILDPPAAKPGTQMPNLGLTDDEATRIVAYLETLK
jgi:cytochrome c1